MLIFFIRIDDAIEEWTPQTGELSPTLKLRQPGDKGGYSGFAQPPFIFYTFAIRYEISD